jgi:hypothetical protein
MKALLLLTVTLALLIGPTFSAFAQETPERPIQSNLSINKPAEILGRRAHDDSLSGQGLKRFSDHNSALKSRKLEGLPKESHPLHQDRLLTGDPKIDILWESFETGIMPPDGWSVVVNNPYTWEIMCSPEYAFEGYCFALCNYDETYSGVQEEWLISPSIDLAALDSPVFLDFWWAGSYYWSPNYALLVAVIIDDAPPDIEQVDIVWNSQDIGPFNDGEWNQTIVNLEAYASESDVRIAFIYQGYDGAYLLIDAVYMRYHAPVCNLSTTYINFDTTAVFDSTSRTFQITNSGDEVLEGTFDIQGADGAEFNITPELYSIAPHDLASFTVWFKPQSRGNKTCIIETGNSVCDDITCYGSALPFRECSLSESFIDFDSVAILSSSIDSFFIINSGMATCSGYVFMECDGFEILEGGVWYDLPNTGDSHLVKIQFAPETAQEYTCTIHLGDLCEEVTCIGTGYEETFLTLGSLTIYADSVEANPGSEVYVLRGNVNINGAAFLPDGCIVNLLNESIAGDGEIYVPTDVQLVGDETVYDGPFTFFVSEDSIGFSDTDNIEFQLGALKISLSQMIILFADPGVSLSGHVVIPSVIDAGWPDKDVLYIDRLNITKEHGIRLEGGFHAEQVDDFDLKFMKLKDGYIEYFRDSLGGLWRGGISAKIADWLFGFKMGFADGDLNMLYIQIEFGKEIPIGTTGLFWKGLSGGAEHWAESDPQPTTYSLRAKIVGGKKIPTADDSVYIFTLDSVGASVTYPPISLKNASGELKLLDEIKIGSAEASYENGNFFYESEMNLFGIYKGWMNAHISGVGFYGAAGGSIQTPSNLPWWLSWARNKHIGYSESEARFDEYSQYIRGMAGIKVCINYWFGKKCKTYQLAYRFHLNSDSPYLHFALGTNYGNLHQIFKRRDGEKLTATYVIPEQTEYVMFFIRQENPDLPEFYLVNPNGDTIGVEHVQYSDTLGYTDLFYSDSIFGEIDPDKDSTTIVYGAFYSVDNPSVGQWSIYVPETTDDSMKIFVNSPNQLPSIRLLRPAIPNDANLIKWEANDFDDDASITFFFDDDNSGFDGLPVNDMEIKEDSKVSSITWDNSDVEPGEYYIYAVIEDSANCPVRLYSQGTIVVESDAIVIPPPTIHIGEVVNSTISLAWTPVPGYSRYIVMYRDTLDTGESFVTGAAVLDTTALVYGLIRGHTYEFKVAATTPAGEIGEKSDSYILKLVDFSGNNSPIITSLDPPVTAVAGELYEYQLTAEDDDGDFDRFELINRYFDGTIDGMILANGLIQWRPGEEQTGVAFIEIWAIDLAGHSDTLRYMLTILDPETVNSAGVRLNSNTYRGLESVAYLSIDYSSLDLSKDKIDTLAATIRSTTDNIGLSIDCIETSRNSNEFAASFGFTAGNTQNFPPEIKVQSSDIVIASVATGEGVELGTDRAVWYNCPDSCNMFNMQIVPAEWSANWVPSHAGPDADIPPIQVILTDQDSHPWEVTSIIASSIRLNGVIAPARCAPVFIDSSEALNRMTLEFNPFLALYSMDSISVDGLYRVTITGIFQDGKAFCASGSVTINDNPITDGYCGDANNDGIVNILDITYLINYIYKGGAALDRPGAGDVNSSGGINILDITYLINYVYKGGLAPDCP